MVFGHTLGISWGYLLPSLNHLNSSPLLLYPLSTLSGITESSIKHRRPHSSIVFPACNSPWSLWSAHSCGTHFVMCVLVTLLLLIFLVWPPSPQCHCSQAPAPWLLVHSVKSSWQWDVVLASCLGAQGRHFRMDDTSFAASLNCTSLSALDFISLW